MKWIDTFLIFMYLMLILGIIFVFIIFDKALEERDIRICQDKAQVYHLVGVYENNICHYVLLDGTKVLSEDYKYIMNEEKQNG